MDDRGVMWRLASMAVAAALVASSCGGESSNELASDPDVMTPETLDAEFSVELLAVVDAVIEKLGAVEAAAAALAALEQGFSVDQLWAAAEGGHLRADGSIESQTPTGPRLGLLILPGDESALGPSQAVLAAYSAGLSPRLSTRGASDIQRLIKDATWGGFDDEARARRVFALILALGGSGYSESQIVGFLALALATGNEHALNVGTVRSATDCVYFVDDESGLVVVPANRRDGCRIAEKLERQVENREEDYEEDYETCREQGGTHAECQAEEDYDRCIDAGGTPASCLQPELAADTTVLLGSGNLITTDKGKAETCAGVIDVLALVYPERVEISYTRTVAAGLPPGQETGSGDVSQYVECIAADRTELHMANFDVATLAVGGFDSDQASHNLAVTVTNTGLLEITGTITATDFLNDWTLEVTLEECTSGCN